MASSDMSHVEHSLLVIALLFIIIIAVKMTSYIVSMFLMAIVLTMLGIPVQVWLKKKGFSDFTSTMLVTLIGIVIVLGFIGLTALSINTLISDMPAYQQDFKMRMADISVMLAPFGLSDLVTHPPDLDVGMVVNYGVGGALSIADALMYLFFVAVLTVFMLLETPRVSEHLIGHFGKESHTIHHMSRLAGYVIDFVVVRTEANFIHGFLFGAFLGGIGVHGAILWGTLTFLLGYIPYFGLLIAAIPALFFAWLQFGVPGAVAVVVAICVLNLIVENPVISYLTARKFEMPALLVLVSVIFWGWLLGLVGMLFAIPFTFMVLLIFQLSEDLRYINVALGVDHLFERDEQGIVERTGTE
jgi:AI-2 transport protein TqsA